MRSEEEIRLRLEEITDLICIIGKQSDMMAVRNELIWVLGAEE